MSPWAWLGIGASVVGAVLRYVVDAAVDARRPSAFPLGTFVINVTGSFVLGIVTGLAAAGALTEGARLVLGTGLCGGFTTFSTYVFESVRLAEDGRVRDAITNVVGSVVAGGAAAAVGLALTAV